MGYGLGFARFARFAPSIFGHDGQIPGYSTLMVHGLKRDITIIIGTNLAASPVHDANAAVVLGKTIITTLQGWLARLGKGRLFSIASPIGVPGHSPRLVALDRAVRSTCL